MVPDILKILRQRRRDPRVALVVRAWRDAAALEKRERTPDNQAIGACVVRRQQVADQVRRVEQRRT